jgi:hypothetical protein
MLHLGPGVSCNAGSLPPQMFPLGIPSVGFQPFLIGDDPKQTTALIPALSILLTLLVFMMGGFLHASVDSSFRSKCLGSDLFTVSEGGRTHDGMGRLETFIIANGGLFMLS